MGEKGFKYYLIKKDRHGQKTIIGIDTEKPEGKFTRIAGKIIQDDANPSNVGGRWSNRKENIMNRYGISYDITGERPDGRQTAKTLYG